MHHGLLTIHMLAFVHGIDGNAIMPVVRSSDDDRINIFSVQNLLIVFCCENIFPIEFLCPLESSCVEITKRHEFDTRYLSAGPGIIKTHDAHADDSHIHLIVGSIFFGFRPFRSKQFDAM